MEASVLNKLIWTSRLEVHPRRTIAEPEGETGGEEGISEGIGAVTAGSQTAEIELREEEGRNRLQLRFSVPRGKVAGLMGMISFLHEKFATLKLTLLAGEGQISKQEYEDKIKETFRQLGIETEE